VCARVECTTVEEEAEEQGGEGVVVIVDQGQEGGRGGYKWSIDSPAIFWIWTLMQQMAAQDAPAEDRAGRAGVGRRVGKGPPSVSKVCPSVSKGPRVSKIVQVCPRLSKCVQDCPSVSKYVQVCPSMSKYVRVCPSRVYV